MALAIKEVLGDPGEVCTEAAPCLHCRAAAGDSGCVDPAGVSAARAAGLPPAEDAFLTWREAEGDVERATAALRVAQDRLNSLLKVAHAARKAFTAMVLPGGEPSVVVEMGGRKWRVTPSTSVPLSSRGRR